LKRIERVRVKSMTRRDPYSGVEPVTAQDTQALADPRVLRFGGDAGKFRRAGEAKQAAALAQAEMATAVETNDSPRVFERAHSLPKGRVRGRKLEIGVAVVGNNGEDRLQPELLDQGLEAQPAFG